MTHTKPKGETRREERQKIVIELNIYLLVVSETEERERH